jgi:hypothetical protein
VLLAYYPTSQQRQISTPLMLCLPLLCTQVGDRAFVYGGRHIRGIVPDDAALFVYDVLDNAWYKPDNVSGTAPLTRSSHR